MIGQRVWYARWLLANAKPLEKKRGDAESDLADLCRDIVQKRRQLPNKWVWKVKWFKKLLPGKASQAGPPNKVTQRGEREGRIVSHFIRFSNKTVRKLAAHPCITADMLPPLMVSEFSSKSD